jgi:uncharacterized protein
VLIVDTGVLVAAADRTDPHHDACAELVTTEAEPLVTTAMVIAESAYLLDRELGPEVEALLYQSIIDGQLQVEALARGDWQRIRELVLTYADMRLGGTDAGLVALAETRRAPHRDSQPPSLRGGAASARRRIHAPPVAAKRHPI